MRRGHFKYRALIHAFCMAPFPVGDMDRPLSSWRYGLAPFQLEIWTGPFPAGDMDRPFLVGDMDRPLSSWGYGPALSSWGYGLAPF